MKNREAIGQALQHVHFAIGHVQQVDEYKLDELNWMVNGRQAYRALLEELDAAEAILSSMKRMNNEDRTDFSQGRNQ